MNFENAWWIYFGMIGLASFVMFFVFREGKTRDVNPKKLNFENLDVMRYVGAICIIILHLRPFQHFSYPLDLFFNNFFTRLFVPFYFVVSGYFVSMKDDSDETFLKRYTKTTIKTYLVWSIVYMPFGFQFIQSMNIPIYLYPIAIVFALLYVGAYYHLWYFPALLMGLWIVHAWKKKHSIDSLLWISLGLFALGTMETYFGVLPAQLQHIFETMYLPFFFTTRNFLFFGLFFITLGAKMTRMRLDSIRHANWKLLLSLGLLFAEVMLLQQIIRKDSNLMFMTAPAVFYLFVATIQFKQNRNAIKYRYLATFLYLVHPMIIVAVGWKQTSLLNGFWLLAVVLVVSHGAALVAQYLTNRYLDTKQVKV